MGTSGITPCIARLSCQSAVLKLTFSKMYCTGRKAQKAIIMGFSYLESGSGFPLHYYKMDMHIPKCRESPCQMMIKRCSQQRGILWPALGQLRPATERPAADIMATAGNPSNLLAGLIRDSEAVESGLKLPRGCNASLSGKLGVTGFRVLGFSF